jgi:hypothetical protein
MNLTPEQSANLSPDHPIFQVMERITKIQEKMVAQDPEIGTHLAAVHKMLGQYEELSHLLTPEQIGVLMQGLQKHTTISLVVEDQKKGTRGKSKKIGVDDIF